MTLGCRDTNEHLSVGSTCLAGLPPLPEWLEEPDWDQSTLRLPKGQPRLTLAEKEKPGTTEELAECVCRSLQGVTRNQNPRERPRETEMNCGALDTASAPALSGTFGPTCGLGSPGTGGPVILTKAFQIKVLKSPEGSVGSGSGQ